MSKTVTEDRNLLGRRNASSGVPAWSCCLLLALLALANVSKVAQAADGASPDNTVLDVTVLDMTTDSRCIAIPLNRSVVVKTTMPIARANVVASEIVEAQAISATELLITGTGYGRTNIVLWDPDERQYLLDVTVELDLAALNEALMRIDPQSTAEAKAILGNIVLSGTVSSAERASRMVEIANLFLSAGQRTGAATTVQNHLDIAGEQQVLLRCVVAEINRGAIRQLNINGFLAGDDFGHGFMVNQLGGVNPINIGAAADFPVTGTIPFLTGTDGIPLQPNVPLSLGFPRVQMQLFIRALADNSLLRVLAEPNLVAISGETATFLAGGEFPVPVPQGNYAVTIEFREFGVRLNFTPVVKAHQKIRLRVAPEVSELDFTTAAQISGFTVPGLSTRSAETFVEMGNGQTIAIAGLLSEEIRGYSSQVPGIGDVPILGALFRSVEYRRNNTELVILVTPEIVSPMEPFQIPQLPGEDFVEPNDFELYALGKLEGAAHHPAPDTASDEPADDAAEALEGTAPERLAVHGPWGHAGNVELR
jgi:pilus assembly protein CpaC